MGSSLNTVKRHSYRRLKAVFAPAELAQVVGGGRTSGMDWNALTCCVASSVRVAGIPGWHAPLGVADTVQLHRTGLFGVVFTGGMGYLGGNYYESGGVFEDIPLV